MSVSIRLSLEGKKGQPVYRIVVCETRSKRNGQYIDVLGHYNPNIKPPALTIDQNKLTDWKNKGAIISSGLYKILKENKE